MQGKKYIKFVSILYLHLGTAFFFMPWRSAIGQFLPIVVGPNELSNSSKIMLPEVVIRNPPLQLGVIYEGGIYQGAFGLEVSPGAIVNGHTVRDDGTLDGDFPFPSSQNSITDLFLRLKRAQQDKSPLNNFFHLYWEYQHNYLLNVVYPDIRARSFGSHLRALDQFLALYEEAQLIEGAQDFTPVIVDAEESVSQILRIAEDIQRHSAIADQCRLMRQYRVIDLTVDQGIVEVGKYFRFCLPRAT